MNKFQN